MKTDYPFDFSVLVITYNHEAFIEKAILSILSQKFDKSIQVVIGIDKSTDRTLEICRDLKARYPDAIELIEHDQNVGMYRNFYETLKRCSGKYVSILEGDDYWTYPYKLQKQYDFFEKHPNCVLCAGNFSVVDKDSTVLSKNTFKGGWRNRILLREDLIIINLISILTTAFRNDMVNWPELEKLNNSPHLDWAFYVSLKYPENGFIYKFHKKFGAYRKHMGGVYSLVDPEKRNQNILKSIYAIYTLDLQPVHKEYLKALFANFSMRLTQKNIFSEPPYSDFYDPSLLIYNADYKIKNSFVKELYRNLFNALRHPGANKHQWKMNFELMRQTRPSLRTLFGISLIPALALVFLLKVKENFNKNLLMRH